MAIVEMWTFSVETTPNIDLTGFKAVLDLGTSLPGQIVATHLLRDDEAVDRLAELDRLPEADSRIARAPLALGTARGGLVVRHRRWLDR